VKHELVSRNQMNLWKCIDAPMSDIKVLDKQLGDFSMQKDIHFTKQDRYSKFKKDCEQNVVEAKRFVGFSFAMVKKYFEGNEEYFKRMNSKQYEEISNLYIKLISSSYVTANMKSGDVAIRKLVLLKGPQNIANYIQYVHGYLVHTVAKEKFGWDDNEVIFNSEIQSIITMYTDYLSMCLDMRNWDDVIQRPEWKFKTYEEIETAHINITEVYNNLSDEQASKRVQKGFDKQKQNWDKFRYDGTRFSVIAPETPYDVINEGIALHHCVKTYLDNIANGETTILFVRKNGELEKPFYTLEVKNNEIRQCHGFANCNTDKEDGLINFLHEYCRKKKIRYSDGNMCLVAN
jgi:hypothetical protein